MKRIPTILIVLFLIFYFSLDTFAQAGDVKDIFITIPAKSIENFVKSLLPYEINEYKNFSGSLWIKSIKDLKIEKNNISFSTHIYGENIVYNLKIGNKISSIELGNVNLFNDWTSSFRFDADKKIFYITPHITNQVAEKEATDKEIILNKLFKVFSGIEYPIELQKINPVKTEFLGKYLTINFEISNIFTTLNRLNIKLRPIPHIEDKNKREKILSNH